MTTVTFFGHWNSPTGIRQLLQDTIIDLIENHNALLFYVGNHGAFDRLVLNILKCIKLDYPEIQYAVVLPYCPFKRKHDDDTFYEQYTIFPEELEEVPPKFAILARNRWMINQSDYVITYVTRLSGGAANAKEFAEKKAKK